jgi:hypothetical protein
MADPEHSLPKGENIGQPVDLLRATWRRLVTVHLDAGDGDDSETVIASFSRVVELLQGLGVRMLDHVSSGLDPLARVTPLCPRRS